MLRWYCWLIFFGVVIVATTAFPTDGDVDEKSLVAVENGIEDVNGEKALFDDEDDEEDDDDVVIDDDALDITGRHFGKRKPQKSNKHKKDKKDEKDKKNKDDDDEDEDESSSSEEKVKQFKKKKCFCHGKKPKGHPKKPAKPSSND